MKLEQLVYLSTATAPVISATEVADILAAALLHNRPNNITGTLAFTENRFMQLLEGSHGSLDVLILKLTIDRRHRDLIFIDRIPIEARSFGNWSMVTPTFTPAGQLRLAKLVKNEDRPIGNYRQLLLDMIAERG